MVHAIERKSDIDFQRVTVNEPHFFMVSSHQKSTLASIEQIKKDSFFKRLVMAPISLLSSLWKKLKHFVQNYLFCCFGSSRDPINWRETKQIFEKIYKVIVDRNVYRSSKDQKARFKEALSQLSEDALERFKYHIGTCRAQMANESMTESQRASWYQKNKGSIDFKQDYFDSISGNTILENAVKSFWKEIQEHIKYKSIYRFLFFLLNLYSD